MDTQKALEWITDIFAVNGRVVTLQDSRETLPEWDSLGSLLLLARLEEDHQIITSGDDLAAMTTVREICDLLERNNAFP
ncbi:MAG TPA: phosphopantetheine-binding protein, partial [Steroidobacteraceae bacterium]|nr:phosphopantetheine-binding protein [Steroidobacteraceae bacterium]